MSGHTASPTADPAPGDIRRADRSVGLGTAPTGVSAPAECMAASRSAPRSTEPPSFRPGRRASGRAVWQGRGCGRERLVAALTDQGGVRYFYCYPHRAGGRQVAQSSGVGTQVGRTDEDAIDAFDRGDRLEAVERISGLDLHQETELLLGPARIVLRSAEAGGAGQR